MKLNVNFDDLFKAAKKMGAKPVDIDLHLQHTVIDPVDIELASGKEIELKDIEFDTGLASHKGRQVLLYIKDHSYRDKVTVALNDGSKGNKFHVADCTTIRDYRENARKRYDRYVIMTNLTGFFPIAGTNQLTGAYEEGDTELCVCKNCLNYLNYRSYATNRSIVFSEFNLEAFFATYSSLFAYLPKNYSDSKLKEKYSSDWNIISGQYKNDKQFVCEHCFVDLSSQKHLLHVHHINGIKGDNSKSNLVALCADCHRKEPYHGHLFVPKANTVLINHLRKEQKILKTNDWTEVYEFSDPSMHGLLSKCQQIGGSIPTVAYEVLGDLDQIVAELELAWPSKMQCVVISNDDIEVATRHGWAAWTLKQAMDNLSEFKSRIT